MAVNNLVLVSDKAISSQSLQSILNCVEESKIKCINIVSKFDIDSFSGIKEMIVNNPRIRRSVFYDCHERIDEDIEHIHFTEKRLKDILAGGILSYDNFTVN